MGEFFEAFLEPKFFFQTKFIIMAENCRSTSTAQNGNKVDVEKWDAGENDINRLANRQLIVLFKTRFYIKFRLVLAKYDPDVS